MYGGYQDAVGLDKLVYNRNELIVRFEYRVFVRMPAVALLWTSLNGSDECVNNRLVADSFGRSTNFVAAIVHLP